MNIDDRIYELASSYFAGEASADEVKELLAWTQESDANCKEFERLREVWVSSTTAEQRSRYDVAKAWNRFAFAHQFAANVQKHSRRLLLRKAFVTWSRVAAVIFPFFVLFTIVLVSQITGGKQNTVSVATIDDESATFRLPDGSEVVLEENSTLTFEPSDFRSNNRKITFTGNAYFTITKDPEHPFTIMTPDVEVRVKGTSFNLKARPDRKYDELSLDNGCVEFIPRSTGKLVMMNPGDEIIFNKETNLSAIRHRDVYGIGVARILSYENVHGTSVPQFTRGNGTKGNPYVISQALQMVSMKEVLSSRHMVYFELDNDIDMSDIIWTPLNGPEDGYLNWISFNGNNHVIRNFKTGDVQYNGVDYSSSFFGVLCGECKNVGFVDANITSVGAGVGILGGFLGHATYHGTTVVENCYFTGNVSASACAGAIGGNVGSKTIIRNCYTDVNVTSLNSYAGGLIGKVSAQLSIDDCLVRGNVTGVHAGGIMAGGQDQHTQPANYKNITVASRSIVGNKDAYVLGDFRNGDRQNGLFCSSSTFVNGEINDSPSSDGDLRRSLGWMNNVWYGSNLK